MLNGKGKEEFEKWLKKQPFVYFNKYTKSIIIHNRDWFQLNERFINALIIEWFDSVGISIEISRHWDSDEQSVRKFKFGVYIMENRNFSSKANSFDSDFGTRSEATTKAIEKAVEIFNKLHNGK